MMLAGEALAWARGALQGKTESPARDAAVLLAHVLGKSSEYPYLHPEHCLSQAEEARFCELVSRRLRGEPVAYLLGYREFMGLRFKVDRRVLIPRPETEVLVEAALQHLADACLQRPQGLSGRPVTTPVILPVSTPVSRVEGPTGPPGEPRVTPPAGPSAIPVTAPQLADLPQRCYALQMCQPAGSASAAGRPVKFADVGCGSGAIGLSLLKFIPASTAILTDVSEDALALARENAEELGVADRALFAKGDLFEPLAFLGLERKLHAIVSNPPYIPEDKLDDLPPEIRLYEPEVALDGGRFGIEVISRLLLGASKFLRPGGRLYVEIGDDQWEMCRGILASSPGWVEFSVLKDYSGKDRVVVAVSG